MTDSFFDSLHAYVQQLALLGFFSGYAIVYAVIIFMGDLPALKNSFLSRSVWLLPYAYAVVGTLFLGYELRELYPDYSVSNIKQTIYQSPLILLGLLSILFWIPALSKRKVLSLIHSLVFFLFIIKDLFIQLTQSSANDNMMANDMKVYGNSCLLNLGTFAVIALVCFLFSRYKIRSMLNH